MSISHSYLYKRKRNYIVKVQFRFSMQFNKNLYSRNRGIRNTHIPLNQTIYYVVYNRVIFDFFKNRFKLLIVCSVYVLILNSILNHRCILHTYSHTISFLSYCYPYVCLVKTLKISLLALFNSPYEFEFVCCFCMFIHSLLRFTSISFTT